MTLDILDFKQSSMLLLLSCPQKPGRGGHRASIMQMTTMCQGMGANRLESGSLNKHRSPNLDHNYKDLHK